MKVLRTLHLLCLLILISFVTISAQPQPETEPAALQAEEQPAELQTEEQTSHLAPEDLLSYPGHDGCYDHHDYSSDCCPSVTYYPECLTCCKCARFKKHVINHVFTYYASQPPRLASLTYSYTQFPPQETKLVTFTAPLKLLFTEAPIEKTFEFIYTDYFTEEPKEGKVVGRFSFFATKPAGEEKFNIFASRYVTYPPEIEINTVTYTGLFTRPARTIALTFSYTDLFTRQPILLSVSVGITSFVSEAPELEERRKFFTVFNTQEALFVELRTTYTNFISKQPVYKTFTRIFTEFIPQDPIETETVVQYTVFELSQPRREQFSIAYTILNLGVFGVEEKTFPLTRFFTESPDFDIVEDSFSFFASQPVQVVRNTVVVTFFASLAPAQSDFVVPFTFYVTRAPDLVREGRTLTYFVTQDVFLKRLTVEATAFGEPRSIPLFYDVQFSDFVTTEPTFLRTDIFVPITVTPRPEIVRLTARFTAFKIPESTVTFTYQQFSRRAVVTRPAETFTLKIEYLVTQPAVWTEVQKTFTACSPLCTCCEDCGCEETHD